MCMGNKAEGVLAIVIGVLALWPNIVGSAAKWIILVSAILLLLDACRNCMKGKAAAVKKKGRR